MRLRLVLAVLLVGASVALVLAPAAPGQDDLEVARAEVAEATERLESLLDRLEGTQRRGNELAGRYWQVESGLELLELQMAEAEAEREVLEEQRRVLIAEVRQIALDRYMTRSVSLVWEDLGTVADREAAEALAELFVGSDQATLDRLGAVDAEYERAVEELEERRVEQERTLAEVAATQQAITDELEELARIRGALDGELVRLEEGLADLEAAEAERLAEAERQRLAEQRRRAEEAAARAAAVARVPTPVPSPPAIATPVPNPQPSEPLPAATAAPNPRPGQPSDQSVIGVAPVPQPTVPNPQPGQPFPTATPIEGIAPAPQPTVPNPQPSEPFPTATPAPPPALAPVPQPSAGGIVCPLAGPFTHTDDFNAPRAVGGIHRANDLIAATGTPVLAVESGTVEHRESSVGGLSARLQGDSGDYYFFTHLSGYENVGAGYVTAGTVIGYVGMTGNAPIPHLHFEIHRGGRGNYTNPYGPVKAACGT